MTHTFNHGKFKVINTGELPDFYKIISMVSGDGVLRFIRRNDGNSEYVELYTKGIFRWQRRPDEVPAKWKLSVDELKHEFVKLFPNTSGNQI